MYILSEIVCSFYADIYLYSGDNSAFKIIHKVGDIKIIVFRKELKEKYEGKLEKELSGPTYEVLGKIMKNIINRKVTGPGAFIG